LRATSFNLVPSLFYLCPKEREVPGWPELDLKDFWKLRLDLLKNLPHCVGILGQGINRSRQKALHAEKLAGDAGRILLMIIDF
jgi:hypothetical protein